MNQLFYRTTNQVAFNAKEEMNDHLKHKQESPFAFTRFKARAVSNYDSELWSKNAIINNKIQNFNTRMTVGKGEHGLPGRSPIDDSKRFITLA